MPQIRVNPEELRTDGTSMQRTAAELRTIQKRLSGAFSHLNWTSAVRNQMEREIAAMQSQAEALARGADEMARFLTKKAQDFEQADHNGASAVDTLRGPLAKLFDEFRRIGSVIKQAIESARRILDVLSRPRPFPCIPSLPHRLLPARNPYILPWIEPIPATSSHCPPVLMPRPEPLPFPLPGPILTNPIPLRVVKQ